jgi:hypothetical protein
MFQISEFLLPIKLSLELKFFWKLLKCLSSHSIGFDRLFSSFYYFLPVSVLIFFLKVKAVIFIVGPIK